MTTACPECEGEIRFEDATVLSEIIECGECLTQLEIIATSPLMLALAPEVEEDWGE
jgi:alpha-aminoadipate/glutamate carrier protein LysW